MRKLPSSLVDVAETLGMPVVLKLMQHFGGREMKMPMHPGDDHPILLALGKQDGLALCHFLSGSFIYIPHGREARSIRREVLALQEAGKERGEIARLLGVSQRHVRRVANKQKKQQPDLFEK